MTGPSDVTPVRGIVLDAETAALVPQHVGFHSVGWFAPRWTQQPVPGDILTHIGGRPVDELVAAHDEARGQAEALNALAAIAQLRASYGDREVWEDCLDAFDFLNRVADLLIDARLVAAWHAQHDTDGGAS